MAVAGMSAMHKTYLYSNVNNIDNAAPVKSSTAYVTYLGTQKSAVACEDACISASNATHKCLSFTWQEEGTDDYSLTCYARFNYPYWMPLPADGITSGMVTWGCTSGSDCSLNGRCEDNACVCNKGYSGPRCGSFKVAPTPAGSGYQLSDEDGHISTWGGAVLSHNGTYYIVASEMENHCGMWAWVVNSRISVGSTTSLAEPFQRRILLEPVFAHEPTAIQAPDGTYVMWYASYNRSFAPCTDCKDGQTGDCPGPTTPMFYTEMRTAKHPLGPWSDPVRVIDSAPRDTDTNFAGVVLPDGGVVGMSRRPKDGGSRMHLVTSDDYTNGTSYVEGAAHLFPEVPVWYLEDPFLWRDCEGNFHAVFHRLMPNGPSGMDGVHAFSTDGTSWVFGGLAFNDVVSFDNGTNKTFHTRERPHVVLDPKDGCTVLAITSGAILQPTGDISYTLLQMLDLQ